MSTIDSINQDLATLERDWKSETFPHLLTFEYRLEILQRDLNFLGNSFINEQERINSLKTRVNRLKKFSSIASKITQPIIKYGEIQFKVLTSVLPSHYFERKSPRLVDFFPPTCALILGSFFSQPFRYGVLIAPINFITSFCLASQMKGLHFGKCSSLPHPLLVAGIFPIIEEIWMRAILQNSITWMTGSVIAGIGISAPLFGTLHLINTNGSKDNIIHFLHTTIHGITYGILNHQFGLLATIAAHMSNNILSYGVHE